VKLKGSFKQFSFRFRRNLIHDILIPIQILLTERPIDTSFIVIKEVPFFDVSLIIVSWGNGISGKIGIQYLLTMIE
jgi:hypothetical protein